MPTTFGEVTSAVFLNDPEAHKLHLEFVVKTAQVVNKGDAVILNTDGTVQAAGTAALGQDVIGVAVMKAAADERVTIAMKGYAVVKAVAAANAQVAGPVELGAYNTGLERRAYAAVAGASDEIKASRLAGHSLTATADLNDEILVCLL